MIGAAIEVQRHPGPGLLESLSEKALGTELKKRGLGVESEAEIIIEYDGAEVGGHRVDLFVENTPGVELRASKSLEDIPFAFVRSSLFPACLIILLPTLGR